MTDTPSSLLPPGIHTSGCVAEDGGPAVKIDFGELLQLEGVTVSLVLRPRQARAFCALVLRQADIVEGRLIEGLRIVGGRE